MSLTDQLEDFASKHNFLESKGALSVALILTRMARDQGLPLEPGRLLTDKGGQVKGLSGEALHRILSSHGIRRLLAREGGRTSRGSIENMRAYVEFLNRLGSEPDFDSEAVENWWVEKVRQYFDRSPLRLKMTPGKSIRDAIGSVLDEAAKRQAASTGTMMVGAVMQHLVGAKLQILSPNQKIESYGFSVADGPTQRQADFVVNQYAIHVTTTPTEALVRRCLENIEAGYLPWVVTTAQGVISLQNLSGHAGLADRIEVLEIEQFLVINVSEWSGFDMTRRRESLAKLIDVYNRIVSQCETDPSLRIELA